MALSGPQEGYPHDYRGFFLVRYHCWRVLIAIVQGQRRPSTGEGEKFTEQMAFELGRARRQQMAFELGRGPGPFGADADLSYNFRNKQGK